MSAGDINSFLDPNIIACLKKQSDNDSPKTPQRERSRGYTVAETLIRTQHEVMVSQSHWPGTSTLVVH